MEFLRQEYWSGLPFPSPVDHILWELSTMTRLSWVALHGMAHSFIELHKPFHCNKTVIHEGVQEVNIWLNLGELISEETMRQSFLLH